MSENKGSNPTYVFELSEEAKRLEKPTDCATRWAKFRECRACCLLFTFRVY